MTKARQSHGLSINTLLVLSFIIVALVPISILGFKVYNGAWENAWREVQEKHQSLAKNLTAPIYSYLNDRRIALSMLRKHLRALPADAGNDAIENILAEGLEYLNGFLAVYALDQDLRITNFASSYEVDPSGPRQLAIGDENFLPVVLASGRTMVSPVVINPFTKRTSLFIALPLGPHQLSNNAKLLVGELKISVLEDLRAGIHFGKHGHSAMVDRFGHVIAHPNPEWMKDTIKDLSNLNIVQRMMAGETGVTEFYSPFKKEDMVAGFASVPKYGWGVMVPQPKVEVEAQVATLLMNELGWAVIGLLLAIIVGFTLANWITGPINRLAEISRSLQRKNFPHILPNVQENAPREIQQLGTVLGSAVQSLTESRTELAELNRSLQLRVDAATEELTRANAKLEQLAQSDHLTQLSNRRHFEDVMNSLATRRQGDSQTLCLLLLDIDHFKEINDQHGHGAGDAVLQQVGTLLQQSLRQSDLAARYAGDEFIILMRTDIDSARQRAAQLREAIDRHEFNFNGLSLHTTVSIGLMSFDIGKGHRSLKDILHTVDEAMYKAKRQGRNRLAEVALTH